MAKRKVSGIGAIDRKIQSTRKQIAAIKKKKADEKRAKKKAASLSKAQNELKRLRGGSSRRRK